MASIVHCLIVIFVVCSELSQLDICVCCYNL